MAGNFDKHLDHNDIQICFGYVQKYYQRRFFFMTTGILRELIKNLKCIYRECTFTYIFCMKLLDVTYIP